MPSLINFRNLISRSIALAIWVLVSTSCIKSLKDESAAQPVSEDVSAKPTDQPVVQTAQEPAAVQVPSREIVLTENTRSSEADRASEDQPLVQTARDAAATPVLSVDGLETKQEDSGEIVSMGQAKRSAPADGAPENIDRGPSTPEDQPLVQTARKSSKTQVPSWVRPSRTSPRC